MLLSGCSQSDRLLGYVAVPAKENRMDAAVADSTADSADGDAPLPCVDSRSYPGGGFYKSDIADTSGMALNGDAASVEGVLRLADAAREISSGSAFFMTPVSFDAGTSVFVHFAFRIGGGQGEAGADGMAFVLQSSASGPNALGMSGQDLGYGPVAPSVAIEIDTYPNDTDPRDRTSHCSPMA